MKPSSGRSNESPIGKVLTGTLPLHLDERGVLGVLEFADHLPFVPKRIFWINQVPARTARGGHAHKVCSQFLVCSRGQVQVEMLDGHQTKNVTLAAGDYLCMPPRIFASQTFVGPDSELMVVCDRPYEAEDYIYDRSEFVIGSGGSS